MKYLSILFSFVLLFCSKTKNSINIPDDFYFKISNGANDSYNSKTGEFKRSYLEGTKSYRITLSDEEKKNIYNLQQTIEFHKFPQNFEIIWNQSDTITVVMPSFDTSIEICENDNCKKVILDFINLRNPINDKFKAFDYKKLYDKIWLIIESKEEYKNIPESDFFYL